MMVRRTGMSWQKVLTLVGTALGVLVAGSVLLDRYTAKIDIAIRWQERTDARINGVDGRLARIERLLDSRLGAIEP